MPKLLVKYADNWADEIDLFGFRILPVESWEAIKASMKEWFDNEGSYSFSVGTNETIGYNSYSGWLRCFEVHELSRSEAAVLDKFFPVDEGFFPDGEDLLEDADD